MHYPVEIISLAHSMVGQEICVYLKDARTCIEYILVKSLHKQLIKRSSELGLLTKIEACFHDVPLYYFPQICANVVTYAQQTRQTRQAQSFQTYFRQIWHKFDYVDFRDIRNVAEMYYYANAEATPTTCMCAFQTLPRAFSCTAALLAPEALQFCEERLFGLERLKLAIGTPETYQQCSASKSMNSGDSDVLNSQNDQPEQHQSFPGENASEEAARQELKAFKSKLVRQRSNRIKSMQITGQTTRYSLKQLRQQFKTASQ